jgi:DNA-binding MarR family transcriptional regulator
MCVLTMSEPGVVVQRILSSEPPVDLVLSRDSHRIKDLRARGLMTEKRDPDDLRRTLIVLTKSGKALARQIERLCKEVESVYLELFKEIGVDLFDALIKAKQGLTEKSLSTRVSERRRKARLVQERSPGK